MKPHQKIPVIPRLRLLYPGASEEELERAQQVLLEYVAVVLRIYDRIAHERAADSQDREEGSRIESLSPISDL